MTGGACGHTFSFFTSFYKKGTALTPGRNHFVEIIKMSNRKPMPFACEGGGFKKRGATTPKNHVLNIKKFSDVNNEYYNNGTRILRNDQHPATIFHSPRVLNIFSRLFNCKIIPFFTITAFHGFTIRKNFYNPVFLFITVAHFSESSFKSGILENRIFPSIHLFRLTISGFMNL